ncbi:MAG: cob(I)yrinic acid a,c-diamide adenosyltransferase, partial [Halanaerobiales bacterium]|nr:cob(I)yrinic acid a,c-diamide adenosyltransferase [Halanaerobiales bacterium]
KKINSTIKMIQRDLFDLAGELATSNQEKFPRKIGQSNIKGLETTIDQLLDEMNEKQLSKFIIPGSNSASAALHIARTVCRRAERRIISLTEEAEIREEILKYINRLSDLIYSMARYIETELDYVEFK